MGIKWLGSDHCDLCGEEFARTMYDARIPGCGLWAAVCPDCFCVNQCELGTGRGQKYERNAEGDYVKVTG